ncbi:hypothetical protein G7Y89_g65 [Cudoniella acicularis]|uniref:Uncharacterized protein n=1 Tax=Cudoniella acicularis TaxID=354080 RepID=A0A8H4WBJ8_9HELO|nr:hypothetical protein G7Y89_g65 [Cudoniella acicularis]
MSLSRAFTTKRSTKKSDGSAPMSRSLTTKHSFASGSIRHKISSPIELISTTNMLSYNAPDIYPKASSLKSTTSSRTSNSDDDSDRSASTASSPTTSTDNSSIGSLPSSPEPNHLSCYFGAPSQLNMPGDEAPVIPKRALSHTKKNAEILARKRSTSRMSSAKNSISTVRSSINMFATNIDVSEQHPFGNELAQVSEIAEDYGISQDKMDVVDEEEKELVSKGLFKFRAEDYMSEIQGLFLSAFGDARPSMSSSMWI